MEIFKNFFNFSLYLFKNFYVKDNTTNFIIPDFIFSEKGNKKNRPKADKITQISWFFHVWVRAEAVLSLDLGQGFKAATA